MVTNLQQKAPAARWNYLRCAASAKGKRLPNEFLSKEDIAQCVEGFNVALEYAWSTIFLLLHAPY